MVETKKNVVVVKNRASAIGYYVIPSTSINEKIFQYPFKYADVLNILYVS